MSQTLKNYFLNTKMERINLSVCVCEGRGGGVFNTVLEKIVLSRRPIYALTRDLYRDEILNYV